MSRRSKAFIAGGIAYGKKVRREALKRYYADPSICKYCEEIICVKDNGPIGAARRKRFCSRSCAAKYNNAGVDRWGKRRSRPLVSPCEMCGKPVKRKGARPRKFCDGCLKKSRQKPLNEVLVEHSTYKRQNLKPRLIDEGLLENRCAICDLNTEWQGKTLILALDHINGIPDDHRLHNLRLLCPNCHSQTDTFSGRNMRKPPKLCIDCQKPIKRQSTRCASCAALARHNSK